jgi:hypothetical protein
MDKCFTVAHTLFADNIMNPQTAVFWISDCTAAEGLTTVLRIHLTEIKRNRCRIRILFHFSDRFVFKLETPSDTVSLKSLKKT